MPASPRHVVPAFPHLRLWECWTPGARVTVWAPSVFAAQRVAATFLGCSPAEVFVAPAARRTVP